MSWHVCGSSAPRSSVPMVTPAPRGEASMAQRGCTGDSDPPNVPSFNYKRDSPDATCFGFCLFHIFSVRGSHYYGRGHHTLTLHRVHSVILCTPTTLTCTPLFITTRRGFRVSFIVLAVRLYCIGRVFSRVSHLTVSLAHASNDSHTRASAPQQDSQRSRRDHGISTL